MRKKAFRPGSFVAAFGGVMCLLYMLWLAWAVTHGTGETALWLRSNLTEVVSVVLLSVNITFGGWLLFEAEEAKQKEK